MAPPVPSYVWGIPGSIIAAILVDKMTKKEYNYNNKKNSALQTDFGAFIERLQLLPPQDPAPPEAPYPLSGLTFAISEVFDIEEHVPGFGNPDWEIVCGSAIETSAVVAALVGAGATCIGKTVVDDLALSLTGENSHYGTPTNPAVPGRIPGGASSGASVAVAAELADFSLGIDTDGGVRVPAGYCGVLGFRPSHGIVSFLGVTPVSKSLDAVGWFAKDARVLRRVGHVILPSTAQRTTPKKFVIADDCFRLSKFPAEYLAHVVVKSIEDQCGSQALRRESLGDYLSLNVSSLKAFSVTESSRDGSSSKITLLANIMQKLKRHEFTKTHGEWIRGVKPVVDASSARQFVKNITRLDDSEVENCYTVMSEMRSAMDNLLKDDGILVIPTCMIPPSKVGAKENLSEDHLIQASALSSLASMSGCCEVAIPLGIYEECPVSVSLVAKHGDDMFLLDTLEVLYATLRHESEGFATSV